MNNVIPLRSHPKHLARCAFCLKDMVPRSPLNVPAYCSYEHAAADNPEKTAQTLRVNHEGA